MFLLKVSWKGERVVRLKLLGRRVILEKRERIMLMSEQYEYAGCPLNKSIIRDFLNNKQPPPKEWLSIDALTDKVLQYHLDNGGEYPNIISPYLPTREILLELYDAGKVERMKSGKIVYFRSLPERSSHDRLVEIIRQELEHVRAEMLPLEQRQARLEALLIELTADGSDNGES